MAESGNIDTSERLDGATAELDAHQRTLERAMRRDADT
jgi:hypothetical protein